MEPGLVIRLSTKLAIPTEIQLFLLIKCFPGCCNFLVVSTVPKKLIFIILLVYSMLLWRNRLFGVPYSAIFTNVIYHLILDL